MGNGEDAGLQVVAVSQVSKDMFVDDELICSFGAEALCVVCVVVKSHGEGTAVGWKCTEEEEMAQFSLSGHIDDLLSEHFCNCFTHPTSHRVEVGHRLYHLLLDFFIELVKVQLHPPHLLLHQAAATRRLL